MTTVAPERVRWRDWLLRGSHEDSLSCWCHPGVAPTLSDERFIFLTHRLSVRQALMIRLRMWRSGFRSPFV